MKKNMQYGYCKICQAYSQYSSIKIGYCFACISKNYHTLPDIDQENLKRQYLRKIVQNNLN